MTKPSFQKAFLMAPAFVFWVAIGASGDTSPQKEPKNPLQGDAKAIEQGMTLYRLRCALCHGVDGRGERATDLTELLHDKSDSQIFRVIERGIPGTEMPSTTFFDDEIWMVISYLRTLGGTAPRVDPGGDTEKGKRIYWGKGGCKLCHLIDGDGGRLGPDLSRVGAARSRAALNREIRSPSENITPGYETVTATTRSGKKIRGCRKSEDAFSIQMMDNEEELRSLLKKDLRDVIEEAQSLMPAYGPDRLTDDELRDLVRYLMSLRPSTASTSK